MSNPHIQPERLSSDFGPVRYSGVHTAPEPIEKESQFVTWQHHRVPVGEIAKARKAAPGLTREAIESFQDAYLEDTGVRLTYPAAAAQANQIMALMSIITRPMRRENYLVFLERMQQVAPHLLSEDDRKMFAEHQSSPNS